METIKVAILSCLILLSTSAFAAMPPSFQPSRLHIKANAEIYTSTANYDNLGGNFESLGNGRKLSLYDFNFQAKHSVSNNFSYFGQLGFAYGSSTNTDFERTLSALTDIKAGAHYRLMKHPFNLVADVSLTYPLTRVDPNADDVIINEGAMEFISSGWIYKKLWGFKSFLYLGFNYRDEGRSGLLPWSIGLERKYGSYIFGGSLDGFESLTDDEFTNTPTQRSVVTDKVNASSSRFYSVNPSSMSANAWFALPLFMGLQGTFGINKTLNGKNYAEGLGVFISLSTNFLLGSDKEYDSRSIFNQNSTRKVEEFEVESEKYDEKLFKIKLNKKPAKKKPRKKKRRRKKRSRKSLLNEAEEALEIKD